jgi:hypothetical protein
VKRVVGIAVACAVAVSAAAASGTTSPTLTASAHVAGVPAVVYGNSMKLSGHESAAGSQTVILQDEAWPFSGGYVNAASSKTTGSYSFTIAPAHATRYRVMVGTATSPVVTVYVLKAVLSNSCNLCSIHNTAGTHTLVVKETFQEPPGTVAVNGPVYFYYGQTNGSTAKPGTLSMVTTVPLHKRGSRLSFTVSYTVRFPKGQAFEFLYNACYRDRESMDGVGLPGHHHCGDNTVKADAYLG